VRQCRTANSRDGAAAIALADLNEYELALELVREAGSLNEQLHRTKLRAWLGRQKPKFLPVQAKTWSVVTPSTRPATLFHPMVLRSILPCRILVLDDNHFTRWRGNILARLGDTEAVDTLHPRSG